MNLQRAILLSLILWLPCGVLEASTLVIRDSIGSGPSLTNGMGGGVTLHDGSEWNTPGLVVTSTVNGKLTEARFVIFARGGIGPVFPPENNLANMYGYPMEFHIWKDGVEGGADSFDLNPRGNAVPGHIDIDVNTPSTSFITIVPFGQTGPVNEFTTFLLTVNLSSFNLVLEGGHQYVMGLIQDNAGNFITEGGFFRISASRATGFEDVFRAFNTNPELRPGYLKSQLLNTFEQYAGAFTIAPLLPGDYDFDGDVDADDYDEWRENFGSTTNLMADGNDNGIVDAADYTIWRNHLGTMAATNSSSAATVPEPTSAFLLLVAVTIAVFGVRVA